MSASDKKKLRKEQNAAAMTQKQQKALKEARTLKAYTFTFVICMVLILAVVIGLLVKAPINGLIDNKTHAVTVGSHKLSITDFSYYYVDAINSHYTTLAESYGQYAQYMLGFSMGKPLDEQIQDKETGASWADYFMDEALKNAKSVYVLYDLAISKGHKMTAEEEGKLKDAINDIKHEAKDQKVSENKLLKRIYGDGADKKSYEKYLKDSFLANSYYNKYQEDLKATYTDEDLRKYEAEKLHEYNSYTFATYLVEVKNYLPKLESGKEYTKEQREAALAAAKADAEALKSATSQGLEAFETAIKALEINKDKKDVSYTHSKAIRYGMLSYESISDEIIDWMAEKDRKDGDHDYFEKLECTITDKDHVHETKDEHDHDHDHDDDSDSTNESDPTNGTTASTAPSDGAKTGTTGTTAANDGTTGTTGATSGTDDKKDEDKKDECVEETTGFYVVYLEKIDPNQMKLVNVRHILLDYTQVDLDEDGKPTKEAQEAVKKKAEDLLNKWKAGEKTSASFAQLAKDNSMDPGSASEGGLYEEVYPGQMVENFNDWCFADGRLSGDTGIVESDYGWHIIYFESYCDINFRDFMITNDKLGEEMEDWYEELLKTITATKVDLKRMKWDITFNISQ